MRAGCGYVRGGWIVFRVVRESGVCVWVIQDYEGSELVKKVRTSRVSGCS